MGGTVAVIDCMGGELGRAMAAKLERVVRPRGLAAERVEAQAQPAYGELLAQIADGAYAGVLFTGSKSFVDDPDPWVRAARRFAAGLVELEAPPPVLGICFGHQLIARACGGRIEAQPPLRRELAWIDVLEPTAPLDAVPRRFRAVIAHRDHVVEPGEGLRVVATSAYTPIQALRHETKPITTVQCHPEHDRALMALDQRVFGHSAWEAVTDDALATCEAPRILTRFAALAAAGRG